MNTYHNWAFFIILKQHLPPPHHIQSVITQIVIDHLMSPLCCGLQHSLQIMTPWDDDDGGDKDDNRYHDDDVFLILNKVYTEKGFRLVAWHMILWWALWGKPVGKTFGTISYTFNQHQYRLSDAFLLTITEQYHEYFNILHPYQIL